MFHAPKHLLINLVVIGGVVTTAIMPIAYAQSSETILTDPAHSLDMEAIEYAKTYNVSFNEALRRLIIQLSSDDVIANLQNKYKSRLAGMYIENTQNYRLVIRLKGNAGAMNTVFPLANKTSVPFAAQLNLSVVFKTGAEYTLAELEEIRDAYSEEFNAIPGIQGTGIDEHTGQVVLDIFESGTASISNMSRSAPSFKNLPVKIYRMQAKLKDLANVRASETIKSAHSLTGNATFLCTSGFNIENLAQTKFYATTAAHCGNSKITVNDRKTTIDDNIALKFFTEFNDASRDFQLMTVDAPLSQNILLPELFIADDKVAKPVTGKRTVKSTVVGNTVCHYGLTTGYSCGTVADKFFSPGTTIQGPLTNGAACGPNAVDGHAAKKVNCARTWVKVTGEKLDCFEGDSGGSVFIGSVAVGLLSKGYKPLLVDNNWHPNYKGAGYCGGSVLGGYMAYMSTDEIYSAGYRLRFTK